ncbi:LLM class flavin-dependent oxidoreductase [Nocardia vinacea]|uniref:LLM class flavin-dependent oxidoreductase n=1 Tax=Nocardia vinacea TaxID=96468 RepID=UPI003445E5E5
MEFGVLLMNYPGCWEDAAFAEQHGFGSAGFVDSPLISGDPFVSMGLTAQATSTMRLGTYLNIASMRSAPAAASAISTINQLAPGRVFFGTGAGYTGRLTFGLKQIGVSRLVEYVNEMRQLLAGEEVHHRHGPHDTVIRMGNSAQIANNRENPIPIFMAADGPLTLAAAGENADGWITTLWFGGAMRGTMMNAPEVFSDSLAALRAAGAAAGRDLSGVPTSWTTSLCILEPGESAVSPRALRASGPISMFAFHSYACNPEIRDFLSPPMQDRVDIYEKEVLSKLDVPRDRLYQAVHDGHLCYLLDGEASVLTEEIVRMMSLTGTASEIAAQLRLMEAAGLKDLMISIPPSAFRETVLDVEKHLMPLLTPTESAVSRD